MDVILKPSGGQNIVLRPQARAAWYPPAVVDAHEVELFIQELDPETGALVGAPKTLGRFPAVGMVSIPHTPDVDRNVRIYAMPYAADNTPGYSDLRHAVQATVLFKRETTAPTVAQVGAATADRITIAVDDVTRFARKRRIRISPNSDMSEASVTEKDFGGRAMPRLIDINRVAELVADFSWAGDDPTSAARFTKTGAGTTSTSPTGWQITTTGVDAATYYTKNSWPSGAFTHGFTLELQPPVVSASDGASLPNDSALMFVENGSKKYELRFDATSVYLNGGGAHPHTGLKVRLVIAAGGNVADLWIGDTTVESSATGLSTSTSGLSFGDLTTADDSEVVWPSLAYALTSQDVTLATDIYVTVAHSSGGAYGTESDVAHVTFASEGASGGSTGEGDLVPRDNYSLE